jgi:hypothetical protein
MSKLSIFYAVAAAIVIGFYTVSTAAGQEPLVSPSKEKTTQESRKSGYRGGVFIFIGHGGGFRGK